MTKARKADADALWQLRPDGLLEIKYVPTEEQRRKKPGRDEYIEGRRRRHTLRVHPSPTGHPPFGRCGYQWQYCETCRFDLQPINVAEMSARGPTDTAAEVEPRDRDSPAADTPIRSETDIDRGPIEGYEYWIEARRAHALTRERGLVDEFCGFLERQGRVLTAFEIRTADEVIFCDLYDESRHILFEAKADALVRAEIRMAIGQLFDYSVAGFSEEERRELKLAVLLPHRPKPDVEHLLDALRIGVAWRDKAGCFREQYPD